ncbi:hypothetical protein DUD43_09180 [Alcaligenes faecalis]|uniref:hypothetical protein n=1 Tax=Alcaligenes faecalis TaxID=511 RepID=UPI0012940D89|nr:hypothetical protein [Alcaligenes faecalis]QFY77843.1 hypothetical protein DUD43_09180 [Alcaligenes faecalis]
MHKFWKALGLALGLTVAIGSVSAQEDITAASEADIEGVRLAMEQKLKDASSARFVDMILIPGESTMSTICGKVNSKNSYGAYDGYVPFYGMRLFRDSGQHLYVILRIDPTSEEVCKDKMKTFKAQQ